MVLSRRASRLRWRRWFAWRLRVRHRLNAISIQIAQWAVAAEKTYRTVRRIVIIVVGSTVLLIGVAMLVLPGPAFVVIPAGLAILATEVAWARALLKNVQALITAQRRPRPVPPAETMPDTKPESDERNELIKR